ncbi:hypothetical protein R1flu_013458 [Riccia fluitans]|uniref:AAA+ ATPase domain-containing protein n=1 Tax=Riccia fluitans TaxID=41844 RepID=A0ABD1YDF6_9MARC
MSQPGAPLFGAILLEDLETLSYYSAIKMVNGVAANVEVNPVQPATVEVEKKPTKAKQSPLKNLQKIHKKPVGVYILVESVIPELMQTHAILGLCGMGGSGKTTLAKLLFNKLSPKFEYSCFISDAKLINGKREELRTRMKTHMHHRGKPMTLGDVEAEWKQIQEKRLIVVLDDVETERDVQILNDIARENSVDESRYIVTSRDEKLLKQLDEVCLYQVPLLDHQSAETLLTSYAFPEGGEPPDGFKQYVDQVVEKCAGLPLTLEVLGKYLGRNNEEETWKQTLKGLTEIENLSGDEKLWAQLKLSYDSLEHEEKEMFLDVACFFVESQYNLREAKCAWAIMYEDSEGHWQNLVDLALVYGVEDHRSLKIHQQLRDLGREIALTAGMNGKASRLWKPEMAFKLLHSQEDPENENDDVEDVVTIRMDWSPAVAASGQDDALIWKNLRRMRELQYVDCSSKIELNEDSEFPPGLVLLTWKGLLSELPFDPALHDSMVVFKLDASSGPGKNALRGVDSLPQNFGLLSSLRILEMTRSSFDSLPDSFGQLCNLTRLKIIQCDQLLTLPETFGKLSKLEYLHIDCKKMHALPGSFGKLSSLQELFLHHCSLQLLPDTFCNLPRLQHLELKFCGQLLTFPKKIGNLGMLEHLEISNCGSLRTLSESFGPFPRLTYLSIAYNDQLEKFPESFPAGLKELKLCISGCPKIETLPESLERLKSLDRLKIRLCCRLQALPVSFGYLGALNHLDLDDCSRLEQLPDSFGHMMNLNHLEIKRCHRLRFLPESFGQLARLSHLRIDDCSKLQTLPSAIDGLVRLEHLEIDECSALKTLPKSFGELQSLSQLKIRYCPQLETLPDSFGNLLAIKTLEICDCSTLKELPDSFGNLTSLKRLEISNCFSLERLSDSIQTLKALKYLQINDCGVLSILAESLKELRALKQLSISKCFRLESIPELPDSVERLVIEWVPLTAIPDFIKKLPALRTLELRALPFLKSVPEWLGDVTAPVEPQCVFRVQDGKFILEERFLPRGENPNAHVERVLEIEDMQAFYQLKYGYKGLVTGKYQIAMEKVRAKDYKQALEHIEGILRIPQIVGKFIEFEESDDHKYTLKDMSTVNHFLASAEEVKKQLSTSDGQDYQEQASQFGYVCTVMPWTSFPHHINKLVKAVLQY